MKLVSNKLLLAAAISALLAGCDSGGINIAPETNDNSVDNSVTNPDNGGDDSNNPCATMAGSGVQGSYDGTHCSYGTDFVSSANPLVEDLYLPALPNGGAHIFSGSLFVGQNFDSDADMAAAGIAKGGDGVALEIQAGATVAFEDNSAFMVVNRGSQLFARGTESAPITFTSESDVRGAVGPEDVSQWGGMVINGFGVTNKCAYTGNLDAGTLALDGECHILAEGAAGDDQSNYGGANNEDSSGEMTYVRVKHTGAQVANGDELNGIAFDAVGSGTVVKNLQAYSTYDDGIEFFGGAVSIENYVALYVRDDSIDIDEGYRGTITNALVIQSETDGNHCIESDGIGSYKDGEARNADLIAKGINSRPVIDGLTCIVSPQSEGTHDPGAGWRFREGIYPTITNSLVVASFKADENGVEGSNYCLRVESAETVAALEADEAFITSNIFACEDKTKGDMADLEAWAEANGNQFADAAVNPTASIATQLQLLEGTPAIFSINGMIVDDAATTVSPVERAYLGALSQGGSDWTQGWTYGLHQGSRAKPLWFE
ncbi:serine/threonine protein kinase [Microbulbifer sp. CAU 1566]|uniref:serine/threonine protein kinase n=1 Tax=Microbulbifer sp. CAU 1566 TaxID=2933269 RepID=UPI0020065246|nr:serine/threonine protein kinase [Microbulbifer sp. CAU 1566]MCK7596725.1 serine/threonine protein kinase [Microbulbifer sp. CAU 1566]